ncbi:fatty acyl-CoA reductase 1 isoform X1 [Rhipicephalus microplus]|uniref:fatty acyl-CoA reductase 1 isoform X1 n=1 Tax=Rhipicephalus microplus TaxID=6941 RepID=UPI003F6C2F6E
MNGAKSKRGGHSPIEHFFRDKAVFITGGTGFLGKILIEKLLRSCSGVKAVYVLLRAKDGIQPNDRLQEMFQCPVFSRLREENPSALSKVVSVTGDILEPGLGLSEEDIAELVENVSIVYHSAASVRFDEPLRKAIDINVLGTRRVLELCHKLKNITAFVHVSTAYCFCNRNHVDEIIYPEEVPYQKVIDVSEWLEEELQEKIQSQVMGGRPTTYHYTKALAESLLVHEAADLPVVILRPSIVTCAVREPLSGWVDNFNGPAGFIIATGKGVLRTMYLRPNNSADIYPVDMVANMMITATWYMCKAKPVSPFVINCTSGSMRRLTWQQIFDYSKPLVLKYPSSEVFRYPGGSFKTTRFWHSVAVQLDHNLPAFIADTVARLGGYKPILRDIYKRIHRAMGILEFFVTHEWTFSVDNLRLLMASLEGPDRETFDFDIRSIDWVAYMEQYILGVRRYVLKEDPSTIPTARRNLNSHNEKGTQNKPTSWTALCSTASEPAQRIYYIGMLVQLLFVAGVIRLLVKHTRTFNDLWWSLISHILQLSVRISLAMQSVASRH